MRVLYILSDGLYLIIHKLVKYRRTVTVTNLQQAFPLKNDSEINKISNEFYKNLCDSIVETIKLLSISQAALNKQISANWEVLSTHHIDCRKAQVYLSHSFNWEWICVAASFNTPYTFTGLYNPVSNAAMDKLMLQMRSRFGMVLVNMNNMQQLMSKYQKENTLWGFIADQNPSDPRRGVWGNFFGRPTSFFKGGEIVARRYDNVVYFGQVTKVKRGHYNIIFEEKFLHGRNTKDEEITQTYIKELETHIIQEPSNWVWSHRRWKHKKPE
jgi:Kdo2-lipid IVA lauroyltransferase/acyltransferase